MPDFPSYVKDHARNHAESDQVYLQECWWACVARAACQLSKGQFLENSGGHLQCLTPPRFNAWPGLLRALCFLLHIWQLCPAVCFTYQPEDLQIPIPSWGAAHACQPRLPASSAGAPWLPSCISGSHTRQVAAGLSPWGPHRADHRSRGEGCRPGQRPWRREACGF